MGAPANGAKVLRHCCTAFCVVFFLLGADAFSEVEKKIENAFDELWCVVLCFTVVVEN
jgi:hypothetical protein